MSNKKNTDQTIPTALNIVPRNIVPLVKTGKSSKGSVESDLLVQEMGRTYHPHQVNLVHVHLEVACVGYVKHSSH